MKISLLQSQPHISQKDFQVSTNYYTFSPTTHVVFEIRFLLEKPACLAEIPLWNSTCYWRADSWNKKCEVPDSTKCQKCSRNEMKRYNLTLILSGWFLGCLSPGRIHKCRVDTSMKSAHGVRMCRMKWWNTVRWTAAGTEVKRIKPLEAICAVEIVL